jgi:nucleoside-diphosphate-sugar epimerase
MRGRQLIKVTSSMSITVILGARPVRDGTKIAIVRPFNIYGSKEHYDPYKGFDPKFPRRN